MQIIPERQLSEDQKNKIIELEKEFNKKIQDIPNDKPRDQRLDNGKNEPYDSIWDWFQKEMKKILGLNQ